MASSIRSSPLQFSSHLPLAAPPLKIHAPRTHLSFATRAAEPETPPPVTAAAEPEDFEDRLSRVKSRGAGKKAEARKARKARKSSGSSSSGSGGGMYLPAVPLKEPKSGGLKVDFGFSPYSERVNGRMAILGLTALLLVEVATGKGVINYHTPGTILLQIYFVASVSAVYLKYEKERVSVWPK